MLSIAPFPFQQSSVGVVSSARQQQQCSGLRRHSLVAHSSSTGKISENSDASVEVKRRQILSRAPKTYSLKDEELVVDKVVTGKVKSIMPFGAFIDLGARIDGLLHISQLGAGFVKNVEDVVKMGEEIQVQIMDVDIPNRRVKLKRFPPLANKTSSSSSSSSSSSPPAAAAASTTVSTVSSSSSPSAPATTTTTTTNGLSKTPTSTRRSPLTTATTDPARKDSGNGVAKATIKAPTISGSKNTKATTSKTSFHKGQSLTGVVKNLTRKGCFVQFPGNEEGFLHANEVTSSSSSRSEPVPIEALVQVGQEVKVRVLRIIDGRLNLTMKQTSEMEVKSINQKLNEDDSHHQQHHTNAFQVAFRKDPIMRRFLQSTGKDGDGDSKT